MERCTAVGTEIAIVRDVRSAIGANHRCSVVGVLPYKAQYSRMNRSLPVGDTKRQTLYREVPFDSLFRRKCYTSLKGMMLQ